MNRSTLIKKKTACMSGAAIMAACWIELCILANAWAASSEIANIGVSIVGNYVTMNAVLTDGIEGKILEAVESGVPMTVTFNIELRKQVAMWNDPLIRSNEVSHTVQFDSLKKVYRFSEVGKNVKRKIITREKDRYRKLMATLKNIPIAPIYRLDPAEKYYVRVKADLEVDRFWFPFNHLFFFVPFNDFQTSWAQTSPITINEDLTDSAEAFSQNAKSSKRLNHVIRSFNR